MGRDSPRFSRFFHRHLRAGREGITHTEERFAIADRAGEPASTSTKIDQMCGGRAQERAPDVKVTAACVQNAQVPITYPCFCTGSCRTTALAGPALMRMPPSTFTRSPCHTRLAVTMRPPSAGW